MRFSPLLGLASVVTFCATASSAKNGNILNSELDTFIDNVLNEWNSSAGVSVAVVRMDDQGGWLVETKGYGIAKADGTKVTPDTLFSLASNSKLFDILATGLLISNESLTPRLSWSTKIASVISDWELMDPVASAESTITDLMSHRTGLPRHDVMYGTSDDVPSILKRLKYLRPSVGFRETFQYNNIMYEVLSYLPTAVLPSKPSLAEYVKANILEPLGMNSTTYSFDVANATGNLADGFSRQGINFTENPFAKGVTRVIPYWIQTGGENGNLLSGPAGIISNAVDVARWLQVLLLNGRNPVNNETVIPADVIQQVATGVTVSSNTASVPELSPLVYGGGQFQGSYRGHNFIEHDGGALGFFSQITRFPFDGLGVAVLLNDDLYGDLLKDVIRYRIIDQALGLDPLDWNTRYKNEVFESAAAPAITVPRPANATPPTHGFSALARKYSNPGYAEIELCLIVPQDAYPSEACKTLATELNLKLPETITTSTPTLVFKWDKVFATHIKLAHFDGNVFNLTGWRNEATGNKSDPLWVYDTLAGIQAEFAFTGESSGFGLTGGIWDWGADEGVGDPKGSTVEERAEVWFGTIPEVD